MLRQEPFFFFVDDSGVQESEVAYDARSPKRRNQTVKPQITACDFFVEKSAKKQLCIFNRAYDTITWIPAVTS